MILRNRNCKWLKESLFGLAFSAVGFGATGLAQQPFNQPRGNAVQGNPAAGNSAAGSVAQPNAQQPNTPQPPAGNVAPAGAPAGNVAGGEAAPVAPFPPLDARLQQYLEQVLGAWEKATSDIERFRCNFTRWEYDPTNGPANTHYTWSRGVLRYMKPDKGLFRVDDILFYKPAADNGQAKYEAIKDRFGDYWLCDGKSIHIYERNEKKVKRYDLPPEMQGVGIYQSPLPFLFGVKSQEVQTRYWIRPVPPENGSQTEVWLEAYPKSQADAANYQKVLVVLDAQEVLPKVLVVFDPNYTPQNPQRTVFEFSERERNWTLIDRINELNIWNEEFIPTAPPKDWKIEVTPIQSQEAAPRVANPQPNNPNAIR